MKAFKKQHKSRHKDPPNGRRQDTPIMTFIWHPRRTPMEGPFRKPRKIQGNPEKAFSDIRSGFLENPVQIQGRKISTLAPDPRKDRNGRKGLLI